MAFRVLLVLCQTVTAHTVTSDLVQTARRPRLEAGCILPHLVDEVDLCSHIDAHSDHSSDRRVHTWRRMEEHVAVSTTVRAGHSPDRAADKQERYGGQKRERTRVPWGALCQNTPSVCGSF